METALNLDDLRRAWTARDPDLARLVVQLVQQPDPQPDQPPREGSLTWQQFQQELRSYTFRKKKAPERAAIRQERLRALEAPDAENPLPDRLRVHEIILELWTDGGAYARSQLLEIIAQVPLKWGPWRALKRIYKATTRFFA